MKNTTNKVFECDDVRCYVDGKPKVFAKASLLKQHKLKVHAAKTFQCGRCPKAFAVGYLLRQHETDCAQMVGCDKCEAKFLHRSSLKRHQKTAHGNDKETTKDENPSVVNIYPVQFVPLVITRAHQPMKFILPKPANVDSVDISTEAEQHQDNNNNRPSIATQTSTNQCNVAVGLDEVLDDLDKIFSQAETQTTTLDCQQLQNAETQTYQPSFADCDMQTYDDLQDLVPTVDRLYAEVQTEVETQTQNFGMQTSDFINEMSKMAETQTLVAPSFDGQSQTLEFSSVETQTIEQLLNSL